MVNKRQYLCLRCAFYSTCEIRRHCDERGEKVYDCPYFLERPLPQKGLEEKMPKNPLRR